MSGRWAEEATRFSPCVEIDSSSGMRKKATVSSQLWMKQEKDPDTVGGQWETTTSGIMSDVEQDNTLSSAVSTVSLTEGLSPSVMLTITRLQCLLESKQEKINSLEKQIEDLQQDRKFLRAQIENLTSSRSSSAIEDSKPGRSLYCDPKPRKRMRATSSSSSFSSDSGSEVSISTATSGTASDVKKKKHHKEKKRGRKSKDYSRKRATGVQYVIHRYKQVLSAFNKKKSMSGAFRHYGIDRNTIANTAPIAELYLAAKETLPQVGLFHPREETLVKYAQKCAVVIESDEVLSRKIELMKATGELLPITAKKSKMPPLITS
ncbi:coiled-coil domain-containing protein 106-like [Scleropages formosus]|uniref:Coiled-coil domain-containing protein 106-like n=1 Tax=Scleropages formosus TaxID=113540 RepID=A0A0P7UEN8_SCLFO|nr:coiled-coil domain-containing protein 106-like [Scleropages formosus]XP_018596612.1 coiled-coil domain-containing protein 106-like [Scleropages formosus]XP_018596613.1 coiled-coil domain-containing protein 106-like [Scleropages formosus]KPP59415.1 coiled-coil domain-containing protein 106-like [Scleropages formosus]